MGAYYNEIDPYCAQWLRNLINAGLIAPGEVDERDIREVTPGDLQGFTQCHFFAGIGGWSFALRLAGWDDARPVWTGSCPCQPFSSASHGSASRLEDERHLWPEWYRLIAAIKPRSVFGEQTAQAGDWLDCVCDDMEALGYSIGATVLPAVAVGADHERERIYFVCDAYGYREPRCTKHAEAPRVPWGNRFNGALAIENGIPRGMEGLRAYGNAVVPWQAAEFIAAFMEAA